MARLEQLKKSPANWKCCPDMFNKLYDCIKSPQDDFLKFRVESEDKSGACSYFRIWLKIAAIIKNDVASMCEGNCEDTVDDCRGNFN